jgi:hypothetical protein
MFIIQVQTSQPRSVTPSSGNPHDLASVYSVRVRRAPLFGSVLISARSRKLGFVSPHLPGASRPPAKGRCSAAYVLTFDRPKRWFIH